MANKEMREALYWLRLVQDSELVVEGDVDALIGEADELVAILTASIGQCFPLRSGPQPVDDARQDRPIWDRWSSTPRSWRSRRQ